MASDSPIPAGPPNPSPRIDGISTQWSKVNDPSHFVLKYAPAIKRYLAAMVKNPHDAEDVLQEFLMRITRTGFGRINAEKGRFRDYLKSAVRYTAMTYHRKRPKNQAPGVDLSKQPDTKHLELTEPSDEQWLSEWRQCLLQRAWAELLAYERKNPTGLAHTALKLSVEFPQEDSKALAARASKIAGTGVTPEAFRKQLSRARRLFAEFMVIETARTLDDPSAELIEQELIDTGVMTFIKEFLPEDWRTRTELTNPG